MERETIVSTRWDRDISKTIVVVGDYNYVPYEGAVCKVAITEVKSANAFGTCQIDPKCRCFSPGFDGRITIGDCDNFIDRDLDLILQQMCRGEVCAAKMVYKNVEGVIMLQIDFKLELMKACEEILVSDWSWERLYKTSCRHKEKGVNLVKEKRIADAFCRFSKSLKLLICIEPVDPEIIPDNSISEMIELKIKLYTNLALCQLHYDEYHAAHELCCKALEYDENNIKALYRRSAAFTGLGMFEDAWNDIQRVLALDPSDKGAQQKAALLKPKIQSIQKNYNQVIKKMFK